MNKYRSTTLVVCCLVAVCMLSENAVAKQGYHNDNRYRHGGRYPSVGVHINVLPPRHSNIRYRNTRYQYYGGVFYHNAGPDFVVVAPPMGIVVPVLPPAYTTLWFHGVPYYYGNNLYYNWQPDRNGYVVVEPPEGILDETPTVMAAELFAYPKEGQSEEQQSDDRFSCHQWAVKQTTYDPSQPPGNVSVKELGTMREKYQRAIAACLEGKGYSVR
ncbi:MAG: hypothetical protein ACI8ZB_003018 [Desulforhopalus sp.]|jgi:hypothetical protein